MKNIYLDHNATTPLRAPARAAMMEAMEYTGNASSTHSFGRQARKIVETARRDIANLLDVSSGQVIFNSGATEGNNTVLKGFKGQRILVGATEHPSVMESGVPAEHIPVTADGLIDMGALDKLLTTGSPPALVSVMLVNNETGVIQPIAEIAQRVKAAGAMMHCDCVQAFGRIPFTRESLGVDILTLSAHKIGGPQGVGALITAPRINIPKLLEGGGQEKRQRAGTENVAGIAGFGAAAADAIETIENFAQLTQWRDKIEVHVRALSRVHINGRQAPRVANTTSLTIDGIANDTLLMAFDLEGIALSSGSACSSGTTEFSHVLRAMGLHEETDRAALRISLGHTTTAKDIEEFLHVWNTLRARLFKD